VIKLLASTAFSWVLSKLFWWSNRDRRLGALEAKDEAYEKAIEDAEKARRIRERVRSDPDYRQRMRDRFTRHS
jgi:hypothetical protein